MVMGSTERGRVNVNGCGFLFKVEVAIEVEVLE